MKAVTVFRLMNRGQSHKQYGYRGLSATETDHTSPVITHHSCCCPSMKCGQQAVSIENFLWAGDAVPSSSAGTVYQSTGHRESDEGQERKIKVVLEVKSRSVILIRSTIPIRD